MNPISDCVAGVAQRANRYNLDDLIKAVTEWNEPEEIRRDLMTIYFFATEALFNDEGQGVQSTALSEAFLTLRGLIEVLSTVSDAASGRLMVTVR